MAFGLLVEQSKQLDDISLGFGKWTVIFFTMFSHFSSLIEKIIGRLVDNEIVNTPSQGSTISTGHLPGANKMPWQTSNSDNSLVVK